MRALSAVAAVLVGVTTGAGCATEECFTNDDCPLAHDCTLDGRCIADAQGVITWVSPEPGSVVGPTFDAVVDVSFRSPTGQLTIDRDVVATGERCAPFIPAVAVVPGDLDEAIVQRITIPGLRSLGEEFGVAAVLNAAGGTRSVRVNFRSEPTGFGGARVELVGEETGFLDAASALTQQLDARLDRAVTRALVSVEPVGGAPSPRQLVGGGVTELSGVRVPLARGPQILWLDTEDEAGPQRCGVGMNGIGEPVTGVELGLSFEGVEPGQVDLRVRHELDGEVTICSFNEPGALCEALLETRTPTRAGEELLLVKAADGVLDILVVPGAASPSLTARVRVSSNGAHVGWLGPFPLQPDLGEVWSAGSVVLNGSLAELVPGDTVLPGAPF